MLIQAILCNFASPNPDIVQLLCTCGDMEEYIHINKYKEGRTFSLLFDLGFTLKPQNLPISWILQGLKMLKKGTFFSFFLFINHSQCPLLYLYVMVSDYFLD